MAEEDVADPSDEQAIDQREARERIARRAYELYEQRGRVDGSDAQDWLQAEQEVRGQAEPAPPRSAVGRRQREDGRAAKPRARGPGHEGRR